MMNIATPCRGRFVHMRMIVTVLTNQISTEKSVMMYLRCWCIGRNSNMQESGVKIVWERSTDQRRSEMNTWTCLLE